MHIASQPSGRTRCIPTAKHMNLVLNENSIVSKEIGSEQIPRVRLQRLEHSTVCKPECYDKNSIVQLHTPRQAALGQDSCSKIKLAFEWQSMSSAGAKHRQSMSTARCSGQGLHCSAPLTVPLQPTLLAMTSAKTSAVAVAVSALHRAD